MNECNFLGHFVVALSGKGWIYLMSIRCKQSKWSVIFTVSIRLYNSPSNPHTLTNQFKQVLRRFSELTGHALVWVVARRMRPLKGAGVGHGGRALFVLEVLHTRGF